MNRRDFVNHALGSLGGTESLGRYLSNSWLRSTGSRVFNAKAFGAVGNGNTDDTKALQLAIDTAHNAGGGTVLLPRGAYRLNTQSLDQALDGINGYSLRLKDKIDLVGEGENETELQCYASDASILYANRNRNIGVRNLTLNGKQLLNNAAGLKLLSSDTIDIQQVRSLEARIGFQLLGC